ncbi:MAG: hypothetical protein IKV54_01610 [Clostridia bacterium]|nr:hypothetical protein [Clostridia bacterium]
MEKKDNGRVNDDMSIEELLRGLSEVSTSEKKEPAPVVESDPEIEELLKKYITEGESAKAEEVPVMETPDYDDDEGYAEEEQAMSTAPVRSMRFKIKSHTRNGVELVGNPGAADAFAAAALEEIVDDVIEEIAEEPQPQIAEPTVEEVTELLEEEPAADITVSEEISYTDDAVSLLEEAVEEEVAEEVIEEVVEEVVGEDAAEEFSGNISFDELEMTGDIPVVVPVDLEPAAEQETEEPHDAVVEETPADEFDDAYSDEQVYVPAEDEAVYAEETAEEVVEETVDEIIEEPVEAAAAAINVTESVAAGQEPEELEEIFTDEAEHARELTADEAIAEYLRKLAEPDPVPEPVIEEAPAAEERAESVTEAEAPVYEGAGLEPNGQQPADAFDETDINLMLALGLEDELAKTVGVDTVSKLSKRMERKSDEARKVAAAPSDDVRFTEYVHSSQNREIQDDYRKAYSGIIFKIIATLILAVGLFLFENISLFGIELSGPFNVSVYPIVYYMVELQLLILVIAVMYRNFFPGLGRLFSLRPTPDSLLSAAGLIAFVYSLVLCIFRVSEGAHLMGFPVALIAVLTAFYEFFNLRREILCFNIISSKKMKYALTLKDEEDIVAERSVFSEYIDEYSTVADLEKVSFVDGFVSRSEKEPYYGTRVMIGLLIPFVAAAIMMIVSVIKDGSWVSALSGSVSTFMFCVPATILYAYSIPFYRAEKSAYANDGAIIGEDTLDEYASTAIIAFDDDEIFSRYGVKVRSVKMYGDNRIDKVIYNTASLFNGLGGLLGDVFRVAAGELGYSENVEYDEIAEFGIKAKVDGEVLYAGSREYIESCGITIPEESEEISLYDNTGFSVMYLATETSAAAKMYISYAFEADFEGIAAELDDAGICLAVNSTDPNITEEMLKSKMPENRYPVKVIRRNVKKAVPEEESRVSSGIVAKGGARSLLSSILLCDKVRHVIGTNTAVKIISAIIGAAISSLIIVSGNGSNLTSVFAGIYQLLWYLPMVIITRMYI